MSRWYVTKEGSVYRIRGLSGRRYPIKLYPKDQSRASLLEFCIRLNGRDIHAKKVIQTRLAFLNVALQEEFRELLLAQIPNQGNARSLYYTLQTYCLEWYIKQNIIDPVQFKEHEVKWGQWLLSLKVSPSTLRSAVQVSNRLLAFLHRKMPKEVPAIKLEPFSRAVFKHYSATWKMADIWRKSISEQQITKLPDNIRPAVLLAYYYGLRRSEIGGLRLEDVRKGHLSIERQYGNKPLKSRDKRQTPHWFCTPNTVYTLISQLTHMHPSTLSHAVKKYGLEMHDCRRSFITRALESHSPKQVMLAVGHANIETTMRYLQDDRALDSAQYVPNKAG